MRIILSTDPIKFPLTGIGRYTYELARGLQASSLDNVLFLSGYRLQRQLTDIPTSRPMTRQPAWKKYAQRNRLAVELFRRANPWLKARALRGFEDYIFHGPNYYLPPFAGPSVVTIHDLSAYLWTESHPRERVRYMQAEIELSLKRASALITDTEFTRHEVAAFFGWPLDKIHAVPLACAPEFRPRDQEEVKEVLARLGLDYQGYTLAIGTIEPRKNLTTLLTAYAQLPVPLKERFPLVLAGYTGWESAALHRQIEKAQQDGWLRYLGFQPANILPKLYAGARLFAFPSLYEGFGLPVLEAMASGIPVICSNASTLPEVAGEAALFHTPQDVDGLTGLLEKGLEDEAWHQHAAACGLARAETFSWDKCTRETIAVYRSLVGSAAASHTAS